jgi:hypothetical protein
LLAHPPAASRGAGRTSALYRVPFQTNLSTL